MILFLILLYFCSIVDGKAFLENYGSDAYEGNMPVSHWGYSPEAYSHVLPYSQDNPYSYESPIQSPQEYYEPYVDGSSIFIPDAQQSFSLTGAASNDYSEEREYGSNMNEQHAFEDINMKEQHAFENIGAVSGQNLEEDYDYLFEGETLPKKDKSKNDETKPIEKNEDMSYSPATEKTKSEKNQEKINPHKGKNQQVEKHVEHKKDKADDKDADNYQMEQDYKHQVDKMKPEKKPIKKESGKKPIKDDSKSKDAYDTPFLIDVNEATEDFDELTDIDALTKKEKQKDEAKQTQVKIEKDKTKQPEKEHKKPGSIETEKEYNKNEKKKTEITKTSDSKDKVNTKIKPQEEEYEEPIVMKPNTENKKDDKKPQKDYDENKKDDKKPQKDYDENKKDDKKPQKDYDENKKDDKKPQKDYDENKKDDKKPQKDYDENKKDDKKPQKDYDENKKDDKKPQKDKKGEKIKQNEEKKASKKPQDDYADSDKAKEKPKPPSKGKPTKMDDYDIPVEIQKSKESFQNLNTNIEDQPFEVQREENGERIITNDEKAQIEHVLDLLNPGEQSGRFLSALNSNLWSLIFNQNAQLQKFKKCVTRKNETGSCMNLQFCSIPNIASSLEQLLSNACVINDVFIGVCCPDFPVESVKVDWEQSVEIQDNVELSSDSTDCGERSNKAVQSHSWPWKAPLLAKSNGKIFCGGVLVSKRYVLTAAHCTTKIPRNQILVRLGEHSSTSGEDVPVTEIKRHAQYNARTMQDDIALLKLSRSVKLSDFLGVICLPEFDDDEDFDDNYEGSKAVLLGWHGIRPGQIVEKDESLTVMNRTTCKNQLGVAVPDSVLCTDARNENERTCNADSGAPLIVKVEDKYEVLGVLSWNRNDCDPRFPSTFSSVPHYRKWILKHSN